MYLMDYSGMLDTISPFADFESAARSILSYLHQRLGFQLWMVTRTQEEDWIMLQVEDHGYGVQEGAVFCWSDSFCSRMINGEGPCIAPRVSTVPAYVEAPIGRQVSIGAYIGIPIVLSNGSLFGTLCAIDPDSQSESITEELSTIELLAKLLSTILENELKYNEQARHLERLEAEVMSDVLTELYNRRGWEKLLLAEEKRCQRYGHPAGVIYIDLDGLKPVNDTKGHAAGDKLIYEAAQIIHSAVREQDITARVGGDEFAVLGIECNATQIQALAERVQTSLMEAGISASVGFASRHPSQGLSVAVEEADQKMYECKLEFSID
ncbi:diguanylate cyclase with GAF sensor [Halothece sp. PCC 7418]|uniref:sensor domain-containing diguanylate cyclase n=1 Tax=Halothece sp. (strain PCC 7418) TaxID=65093 RepID=UPI0002A0889D|nr:sensor domain-containing diguanylate cyclase [Halothece sp. PCC 7418]AFZ43681.1 diguanylate cyclase with GAF sensor [Halothece sp. PCC 7418]